MGINCPNTRVKSKGKDETREIHKIKNVHVTAALSSGKCSLLSSKQRPEWSSCFSGIIKSESLSLKAQCMCGEVGMLINVFGTTPPLSSQQKKTRWLHRAYMELPVKFFVALISYCLQGLATAYIKEGQYSRLLYLIEPLGCFLYHIIIIISLSLSSVLPVNS